jgi:hypothetical protein
VIVHSCDFSELTFAQQETRPLKSLVTDTMPTIGRSISDRPSSGSTRERGMTNTSLCSPSGAEQLSGTISQDAQDSLSPMERFVTLSPANDPCPWETRRVIKDLGLRGVSSEGLRVRRHDAAVGVTGTSNRKADTVSLIAVAGSL